MSDRLPSSSVWRGGRFIRWAGVFVCILIIAATHFSTRYNITYAGRFGFFVLTDGYIVLPTFSGPRTWGDWGWIVQDAWGTEEPGWSPVPPFVLPPVRTTRQVGAPGLHIALPFVFICLSAWLATDWFLRPFDRTLRVLAALALAEVAWIIMVLIMGFLRQPIFAGRIWLPVPLLVAFAVLVRKTVRGLVACWKFPPGHCQTGGYNLFGNVSGICPECGRSCPAALAEDAKPG